MERNKVLSQSGFTLVELPMTMAILGILGATAMLAMGHLREKAQETALDASLHAVSTAAQVQMTLENVSSITGIDSAQLDISNAENVDFLAVDPTSESVIIQARPKGADSPCRQIVFPDETPRSCDPVAGRPSFAFTPGQPSATINNRAMSCSGPTDRSGGVSLRSQAAGDESTSNRLSRGSDDSQAPGNRRGARDEPINRSGDRNTSERGDDTNRQNAGLHINSAQTQRPDSCGNSESSGEMLQQASDTNRRDGRDGD